MPSHIHLIYRAKENNPEIILGRFKEYTQAKIKAIDSNLQESRREWMPWMFARAGQKSSNVKSNRFWQHNNKPIELWGPEVIEQKAEYTHTNPVIAGFVKKPGTGSIQVLLITPEAKDWSKLNICKSTRDTRAPAAEDSAEKKISLFKA